MHGYAGTVVFHDKSVLLVRDRDFFTGEPLWTLPSGRTERGETPEAAAARELAEESGCLVDPVSLRLISTVTVRQDHQPVSQSWNFTTSVADVHLAPADPDGTVDDAGWFSRAEAIELLARLSYDPIREPALRFLGGSPPVHWTFDLIGTDTNGRPEFAWEAPPA